MAADPGQLLGLTIIQLFMAVLFPNSKFLAILIVTYLLGRVDGWWVRSKWQCKFEKTDLKTCQKLSGFLKDQVVVRAHRFWEKHRH